MCEYMHLYYIFLIYLFLRVNSYSLRYSFNDGKENDFRPRELNLIGMGNT